MDNLNYYEILHVQRDAPQEIIKASYRALMMQLKNHPDRGGDNTTAALINIAYQTLSDPIKRAKYDLTLQSEQNQQSSSVTDNIGPDTYNRSNVNGAQSAYEQSAFNYAPEQVLDQRKVLRISKEGSLYFYVNWPGVRYKGIISDASPQGMSFWSNLELQMKQSIRIETSFMSAVAQVVNMRQDGMCKDPKYQYLVGVKFINVVFLDQKGNFISGEV